MREGTYLLNSVLSGREWWLLARESGDAVAVCAGK